MNLFTAISLALGFVIPFASKKIDCMACAGSFELDLKKRKVAPDDAGEQNKK